MGWGREGMETDLKAEIRLAASLTTGDVQYDLDAALGSVSRMYLTSTRLHCYLYRLCRKRIPRFPPMARDGGHGKQRGGYWLIFAHMTSRVLY